MAVFRWVGGPVELDHLVEIIAALQGTKETVSQEDYAGRIEDAPDRGPTPADRCNPNPTRKWSGTICAG